MSKKILVIAPHPDDETLGCGGSLLKHKAQGDEIHWLIVTVADAKQGFAQSKIDARVEEIKRVAQAYGFTKTHEAKLATTMLDTLPKSQIVQAVSAVVNEVQPHTMYIPYRNDVHSDHAAVFDAAASCTKSFRYPSVKRVLAYEALSETEFGIRPDDTGFRPNVFIDVSPYAAKKIEIMKLYAGEMGAFPFPRSAEAIDALMKLRGSTAGVMAAEAFMLLKEIT